MDRNALLRAKGPRHQTAERTLEVAQAAAQFRKRAQARAQALGPAALEGRAERIERLRAARRRD